MTKVLITAQVENLVEWEAGFRTHGDLIRSQTVTKPVHFATNEGNEVAVCIEPDNLDTCLEVLNSPATAEAMASDGVNRETVKIFILDKELVV